MDRIRRPGAAIRRPCPANGRALIAGLVSLLGLALAGCQSGSAASPASASTAGSHAAAASASPSLSIPGTHKATTVYQISSPVAAVVVISHAGNVTISGRGGTGTSVTEQAAYSKTAPATTRMVSGKTLTITYSCPVELVCAVAYVVQVPRGVAVQATAGAGAIRLSGLAGNVTAKAGVGFIDATGLTGSSVSLTTGAGGINAAFAATPHAVQATARVGAVAVRVPGGVSYQVTAHAHLGKATVSVPQSSSSAHTISATTDVGTILIAPTS
jgi:hypothetical protein